MKHFSYLILGLFALLLQSFIFESNNHQAIRLFRKDLNYIEKAITTKKAQPEKLLQAISNIENISNIRSEAGGDIFGRRFYPTQRDIANWKNWLDKNKKNLRWDAKNKRVYLYVEKKLPGVYYQI